MVQTKKIESVSIRTSRASPYKIRARYSRIIIPFNSTSTDFEASFKQPKSQAPKIVPKFWLGLLPLERFPTPTQKEVAQGLSRQRYPDNEQTPSLQKPKWRALGKSSTLDPKPPLATTLDPKPQFTTTCQAPCPLSILEQRLALPRASLRHRRDAAPLPKAP